MSKRRRWKGGRQKNKDKEKTRIRVENEVKEDENEEGEHCMWEVENIRWRLKKTRRVR
jgi:hypothetical protein